MAHVLGRGSSVAIVTRYGQDGLLIKSRWSARISAPAETGRVAHPRSGTVGTGYIYRGLRRWDLELTNYPHLVPRLIKV